MSDAWLDMLPSSERQKIKEKYKMSAAAYEKLRQKIKGPEDIEREMQGNEKMAQMKFALETEPEIKKALQEQLQKDIGEHGIEGVLESTEVSDMMRQQIKSGQFVLVVDESLSVAPEGNISETLPVKKALVESYLSQLS